MVLKKYKITIPNIEGFMVVVYHDNHFKSVINEFKKVLEDQQINWILNHITDSPTLLIGTIEHHSKGKVKVAEVSANDESDDVDVSEFPVNEKVAIFCEVYEQNQGIKYKASGADIGQLKRLNVSREDYNALIDGFFKSNEWYLKLKSVGNFVKQYNAIRALVFAPAPVKTFPLPYDHEYFSKLGMADQKAYWKFLRENGYTYEHNGRVGKWILKSHAEPNKPLV